MSTAIVRSPPRFPFCDQDNRNLKAIGQIITTETRTHKKWTTVCTNALENSPWCLFWYDRFNFSVKKAFGADKYIALNPCMILCLHPVCRQENNGHWKLRFLFNLTEYLLHLEDHSDTIGNAMQLRFAEVHKNPFATTEELDALAPAPFTLCENIELNAINYVYHIEQYGIKRILHQYSNNVDLENLGDDMILPNNPNYVCHWKDLLISSGIINSSSLSFQEDDAFIFSVLRYPDPIPDWSVWGTLSLYAIKIMSSISASALNLFRGATFNRITTKSEALPDVKEFARNVNHPCPSVTTTQKQMPKLRYDNKTYHPSEILFHIKKLDTSENSFRFCFSPTVIRFPVVGGIDEQETNQGTFVVDGELCGLRKKMTAADIRKIGIQNLGTHISKENPFVVAVRECRLTDFSGIFCSNSMTSFETHALTASECTEQLDDMVAFAIRCERCLKLGEDTECKYERIDVPCEKCNKDGVTCKSLVVFHVTWDMGSGHKKTVKENPSCLDASSDIEQMMSPKYYTIGFGGLHLCKAFVNIIRNYVIQHNGEYFGTNILIALRKNSTLLQMMKNAVFVGKDRQSDFLAFLTVWNAVQEALRTEKQYCIHRLPEKYMPYKKNASSQRKIVYAVDVCSNINGEIFLLDAGAACIHVVDRSTVAAVFIIGKYNSPNLDKYAEKNTNAVTNIRLSNSLIDLSIDSNNNVFVTDSGRREVVVICNCIRAKKVTKTIFHTMKVKGILSSAVSKHDDNLYVLRQKKSGLIIQLMSFDLKSKNQRLLEYSVLLNMRPSTEVKKLFALPFDRSYGGMDLNGNLKVFYYSAKSKGHVSEYALEPKSLIKPFVNMDGSMLTCTVNGLDIYCIDFDQHLIFGASTEFIGAHEFAGSSIAYCMNGKVISAAVVNENAFSLLELGPLNFAVQYTEAISALYDAIGYVPPRGDRVERMERRHITFQESILKGKTCVKLMTSMQKEAEDRNPGRSSFMGADGMPFTDTIVCLESTVESWETVETRVELCEKGSSSRIDPPSVTSEKNVEHGFGFTTKKGQGHNQDMQEYNIAKRRHTVGFQLRMCQMPFCQDTKEKLQDKGYQQIEGNRCKISIHELREIFSLSEKENCKEISVDVTEENGNLLRKAYVMSKSVPRQSNRAKWREKSGFQPNMLVEQSVPGMLYKHDLVCCRSINDTLMFLIVQNDILLNNDDVQISVCFPDGTISFVVSADKLVTESGQIMTLPMQLYQVVDGEIRLSDAVSRDFEELLHNQGGMLSDEEWALLIDTSSDECHVETTKTRKRRREDDDHEDAALATGSCQEKQRRK